ncbi:MAG: hypothetical protein LBT89_07270 [Planctomycetaceae bacterium]|jgi:hypothetical protein|nr:hypothetical protein [Planctomycetaceae bacterium]
MSYRTALAYLAKQTATVELSNRSGGRAAVCPLWNGQVMTSCCDGFDSESFGFINVAEIDKRTPEKTICNFGGEDIWTITPVAAAYEIENDSSSEVVLTAAVNASDANGKAVRFQLKRTVSLLDSIDINAAFGSYFSSGTAAAAGMTNTAAIAERLNESNVLSVGFVTHNAVRSNDEAVVSSRMRGMFNAAGHTAVIVPVIHDEDEESDKFPYRLDFLGASPHQRIRHLSDKLLFAADGEGRCQLSLRRNNAAAVVGSIEFRSGTLTLWTFQNNSREPVAGGQSPALESFLRFTNYGKRDTGIAGTMKCYEVNSFSSPQDLYPDEELVYRQYTLHISAENGVLNEIMQSVFAVTYQQVYDKMNL